MLKSDGAFARCLALKLTTYALGRGLSKDDEAAVAKMVQSMGAGSTSLDGRTSGAPSGSVSPTLADLIQAIVASDLFRMSARYAERKSWRVEALNLSESGAGGIKEVTATIEGKGVYSRLKYESGVHRVQRVPATEASGRIHVHGDGGGPARGGRGRHSHRCERPARRHVLFERTRWPECQHDVLGGSHHAHSDQHRRLSTG
jgi:hypothetical protein